MLNLPVHGPARPPPLIRFFERYARTFTEPWFATPLFVAMAELATLEGRLAGGGWPAVR
jgi:hypothetical protein